MKIIDKIMGRGNVCQHPFKARIVVDPNREQCEVEGCTNEKAHQYCSLCSVPLEDEPTFHFRKYLRFNKAVKRKTGYVNNQKADKLVSPDPVHCVGLRFVVVDDLRKIRRAWVTFDDKSAQRTFMGIMVARLSQAQSDEEYNAIINEALAEIRAANPDVEEEVVGDDNGGETESE